MPQRLSHPIDPVFDSGSRVLILGSFPSVRSRAQGFFYGHPQNRFWPVVAAVFGEPVPQTVPERRALLLRRGIALWDVIASCEIEGSSDASIREAVPTDLSPIFETTDIRAVFANGGTAGRLYRRWQEKRTGRPAAVLPSTSAANAAWPLPRLVAAWRVIREAEM